MVTRTEIINKIFKTYGFKSYLEIGVRVPSEIFDKINSETKESVDPDPKGFCTHIMTSDDYFLNHAQGKMCDVIFVDGLHTAEQSYIDVVNSINHLNDNGFIIMHDCNPPTEYHIRSYEQYLKTRGQWNGTVFKGFLKLKQELVNWSCFVINEDFGCGIITKRNILKNNIHACNIDDLNWNYFSDNRNSLLQLKTFDEFCRML